MPWSRPGRERCYDSIINREAALGSIESISDDLVETQIGHERVTIFRIKPDAMRMWGCLSTGMDA